MATLTSAHKAVSEGEAAIPDFVGPRLGDDRVAVTQRRQEPATRRSDGDGPIRCAQRSWAHDDTKRDEVLKARLLEELAVGALFTIPSAS
jgi:hypothetical protein